MNIALRRFLHNHGNIATEGSPKPGLCPTLISNDFKFFYSAQYHRQHRTLHAFEQLGALCMLCTMTNIRPVYAVYAVYDDKYPSRPRFEPGTPRLQAPVDTNEPSGPALISIDQGSF